MACWIDAAASWLKLRCQGCSGPGCHPVELSFCSSRPLWHASPLIIQEKFYWQTSGGQGDDATELSSSEIPALNAWILGNNCGIIGLTGTGKWRTELAIVRSLILPTSLHT